MLATFGAPVIESYGMTEAAHQMASNPLPPAARKPGIVGIAAGPEVAIMSEEDGRLLSPGETGEIVIRGPNVTAGYDFRLGPALNLSGFVRGSYVRSDIDAYAEQGGLVFDLA